MSIQHTGSFREMTEREFSELSRIVSSECGIKMPPAKKSMLESRLAKRLRTLSMTSYSKYIEYIKTPQGRDAELTTMIDAVTTNKTDFMREPKHFEKLVTEIVPDLANRTGAGFEKKLRVWSAACSSGEEPYTIAMFLNEFASRNRGFQFSILATDISTDVLRKATLGIYDHERIETVDVQLRKKYLLKGKGKYAGSVRLVPGIREIVSFRRINFMDEKYDIDGLMDIIFCRNALIYFDRGLQEKVLNRLCRCLVPGGYLLTGHSETLNGLNVPVENVTTTIYRKRT